MKATKPKIAPDDIYDGWMYGEPVNLPISYPESRVLSMWWD